MYDIENVPLLWRMWLHGFARLDAYTYRVLKQIGRIGVYLYILEANFLFPQTLYEPNATSAEFLEVQIFLCVLVYDGDLLVSCVKR